MIEPKIIALKLHPKAETILKKGHPWIYSDSIAKCPSDAATGDMAIIFSHKDNKLIGVGLYDADSPIRIKILQVGSGLKLNEDFFYRRFNDAFLKRKGVLDLGITDAYRLVYGESDALPSLIVDVYVNVVVVKLYSSIWIPRLEMMQHALVKLLKPQAIVLRLSRNVQKETELEDATVIYGSLKEPEIQFQESGVKFKANVLKGHKTGYFLDHRANRIAVGKLSKGKEVLDVFSYAGGFAVHALAGGAKKVVSVDISQQALDLGQQNALLNFHKGDYDYYKGDAFEILKRLIGRGKYFDVVVIDPPSFAKQQSQIPEALRQYERLAELGVQLCNRGGMLVLASCSSRVDFESFKSAHQKAFKKLKVQPRIVQETHHDFDHPVSIPESEYLKTVYYQL